MTAGVRDAARIPSVRWVGTWAVVASGLAIAGSVAELAFRFGFDALTSTVWDVLPWLTILVFALLARLLPGAQSLGSALGVAVLGSLVAGPQLVTALVRWALVVGSDAPVTEAMSPEVLHAGLALQTAASLMLLVAVIVPVARICVLDGSGVPRSPFRVEVLALIAVLVLTALATVGSLTDEWAYLAYAWTEAPGWIDSLGGLGALLAWLVPLALVLALSLRSSGSASLWVVGALLVGVLLEPLLRALISAVVGGSAGDTLGLASFAAPDGPVLSRGLAVAPSSVAIVLPSVLIALVVLLWNTRPAAPRHPSGGPPPSAPLDTWAAVAFLLSFLSVIPLIAIPAIILGHTSYEGIVARGEVQRGRLMAAAAIVVAILLASLVILIPAGGLALSNDLVSGDVIPW